MKVLILFLIYSVALATCRFHPQEYNDDPDNSTDVQKAFIKFKIDALLPSLPKNKLRIHYDTKKVNLGNEFKLEDVEKVPTVTYDADPESYYTLMMFDIDSPDHLRPFFGEIMNWLMVNIPGSKLNEGETVAEYATPLIVNKGLHRIVFLLFKQTRKEVFNEEYSPGMYLGFQSRIGFSSVKFQIKYNLGKPIAGNFLMLEY